MFDKLKEKRDLRKEKKADVCKGETQNKYKYSTKNLNYMVS